MRLCVMSHATDPKRDLCCPGKTFHFYMTEADNTLSVKIVHNKLCGNSC